MTTFDIVQTVEPGTPCSYKAGRWQVDHRGDRKAAEQTAELFQSCTTLAGIRYTVEEHDELSEHRAPPLHSAPWI
jgi:hypothetical protein